MDKKDITIIILLIIIICGLSYFAYGVYAENEANSQPEVFEFDEFNVTCPPGTHYHGDGEGTYSFYVSENDNGLKIFGALNNVAANMSVEEFDDMYNDLKREDLDKSDYFNFDDEVDFTLTDLNAGDFKGNPECSFNIEFQNQRFTIHCVKYNNRVNMYAVNDLQPNATAIYESVELK